MKPSDLSIGVVIPTWRAEKHLKHCLPPLINSPLKPRILLIDSSSDDQTIEMAKHYGVETLSVPKRDFNHGLTREKARAYLGTDIIVMITQDAYSMPDMLEKLVEPLITGKASMAYGRQLPHLGAEILEAFPRYFNYPETRHIRELSDISKYGSYTFFCSNSCAAYLNNELTAVGGFPHVLLGEDTLVCIHILSRGGKIAYVSDAIVRHSHKYSLKEEFKRYFDTGYMRRANCHLFSPAGKDTSRGKKFFIELMKEVIKKNPLLLPYALSQTLVKFLGYHIGRLSFHAPSWFCKALSAHKEFFK